MRDLRKTRHQEIIVSFNTFILLLQIFSTTLATFGSESNKNEEEGSTSVLLRLSHLEVQNQQQNEKIENLEKKVENYENVLKNLEEKFEQQNKMGAYELKRNEFNDSSYIVEEKMLVPSGTNRVNERIDSNNPHRGERPARLFPSYMFNKPIKENENFDKHPSSCKDLNEIGYTLNGFYLIKSKIAAGESARLQSVFCNFINSLPSSVTRPEIKETLIGYHDVKTIREGVHFYAHKSCSAYDQNGIVHFDLIELNLGGGYDASTGVFTSPTSGVYQFSFNALKEQITNPFAQTPILVIHLRVNRVTKGVAFSTGGQGPHPVGLHSTLKLRKGDTVDLYKSNGKMNCNDKEPSSHFIGSLLEEDLNISE